jgi:hypothetical protein
MVSRKWFDRVGLAFGLFISVIFPMISSPHNLSWPFELGGISFGMLGFATMYVLLKKSKIQGLTKWWFVVLSLIVGLVAARYYIGFVNAPEYATPPPHIELAEFVLFCTTDFGIFAFVAFVYRNGGAFILRKLGRLPIDGA